ncbi:MAG TPA: hypothetical protein VKT99_03635 [Xanthobacteraceae bacterium]|nr:hypothetical protein [Xanthobacteraceae bacterium]
MPSSPPGWAALRLNWDGGGSSGSDRASARHLAAETVGSRLSLPTIFFDFGVDPLRGGGEGCDNDARGAFEIAAVEAAQRQPAAGETVQQKRPDMGFVRASAGDGHQIFSLEFGRR